MLKVDFHTHTADDPRDYIPHTAQELIDRASELSFDAVAVTLHNRQLDLGPLEAHARSRALVLIPGVERDIEGKHVLLLNFSRRAEQVGSFHELGRLRDEEPHGLVIAPHPFYPGGSCLGSSLDQHALLFDAVERNAMYTRRVDYNRAAEAWARSRGRPVVGNGDVHQLDQLGTTYTLVDAEASAGAICEAVRHGRVRLVTTPLSMPRAAWTMARILPAQLLGSLRNLRPRTDFAGSRSRRS